MYVVFIRMYIIIFLRCLCGATSLWSTCVRSESPDREGVSVPLRGGHCGECGGGVPLRRVANLPRLRCPLEWTFLFSVGHRVSWTAV